ncbi:MAG: hypothetical protein ACOY16_02205 [Chloroflexota bacterium]
MGGQGIGVAHQFLDFVALAASLFMPMGRRWRGVFGGGAFGDASGDDMLDASS